MCNATIALWHEKRRKDLLSRIGVLVKENSTVMQKAMPISRGVFIKEQGFSLDLRKLKEVQMADKILTAYKQYLKTKKAKIA